MNRPFFTLVFLLLSIISNAQELTKQKEIGLTFTSLNNFGITYRIGKNNSLWRFNALALSGGKQNQTADSIDFNSVTNGFDLRVGKEFRRPIEENLVFRFGLDLSFYYSKYDNKRDDKSIYNYDYSIKTITYGPGLNLVVGLNYQLGKHFALGAELLPSFQYTTGTKTEKSFLSEIKTDISGYSYGISNTTAALSIVYQF